MAYFCHKFQKSVSFFNSVPIWFCHVNLAWSEYKLVDFVQFKTSILKLMVFSYLKSICIDYVIIRYYEFVVPIVVFSLWLRIFKKPYVFWKKSFNQYKMLPCGFKSLKNF